MFYIQYRDLDYKRNTHNIWASNIFNLELTMWSNLEIRGFVIWFWVVFSDGFFFKMDMLRWMSGAQVRFTANISFTTYNFALLEGRISFQLDILR